MSMIRTVNDEEQLQLATVVGYCAPQLLDLHNSVQQGKWTSGAVHVLLDLAGISVEGLAALVLSTDVPDA